MAKPNVLIAGASGFVGTSLRMALAERFHWIALTRSEAVAEQKGDPDNTEWRRCDLYSLPQLQEAAQGAHLGLYLVHSMQPSSRLVQASFQDLDLLLADNFIRGCEAAGVEHVIYLGGLIPEDQRNLSPHLSSRLEVESVLRGRSIPVTVLRAGLIFGPGGSSARMLINLVRRLPLMLLPKWTESRTQSIDIKDVVRCFDLCLSDPSLHGGTYDIAGHRPMTYREMIHSTATVLGKKRVILPMPANLFRTSRYWIGWVGDVSAALVGPLLDSLKHSILARPNPLLERVLPDAVPFEDSVRNAVDERGSPLPNPRAGTQRTDNRKLRRQRRVRSVQRMPLPPGLTAPDIAQLYGDWLTAGSHSLINVERDSAGIIRFFWRWPQVKLLELSPTPFSLETERRRAFYITGGLLARDVEPPGRFEFRIFPANDCLIAAIHGYAPSLPWWLYAYTQAAVHLVVMRLFGRHLGHLASESRPAHP